MSLRTVSLPKAATEVMNRLAFFIAQRNLWSQGCRAGTSAARRHGHGLHVDVFTGECTAALHTAAIRQKTEWSFIYASPCSHLWSYNVVPMRNYAKGKSKGGKDKKDKKGGKPRATLTSEDLNAVVNFDKMKEQMAMALTHLQQDFVEQLSVRTNASMLDSLMVETPDGKFPLIQLASISQKGPQMIVINASSVPQYITHVKKAILESGMNFNPQQDGTSLFLPIPKVTREHREKLSSNAKALCDKTKVKIRDLHNRYARDLKKHGANHSEDLVRHTDEHIQFTSNDFTTQIDNMLKAKQSELLGK